MRNSSPKKGGFPDKPVRRKTPVPPRLQAVLSLVALSALPWWFISIMLHALGILLMFLLTWAVPRIPDSDQIVVTTNLEREISMPRGEEKARTANARATIRDAAPTDPTSTVSSDVVVPPDILAETELTERWENTNPDRPGLQVAFGDPEARMFLDGSGSDDGASGGLSGGTLEEVIGAGGSGSIGTGGGWGGGNGPGMGGNDGSGRGSFGQRGDGGRRTLVRRHGGSRATESSVEHALAWLSRHQEPDGHWDAAKYGPSPKTDTACTGLALLAFLGAGHTEKVGQYKENVKRAVAWLESKQEVNGLIYDATDAGGRRGIGYPHAIAGMALAEAAGMAKIPSTIAAAQRAVDYSVNDHQSGDGIEKRGFRYSPKQEGDISVTGWFVMQLKSAKVCGLNVDYSAFEGAVRFLDTVEHKGEGGITSYGPASVYYYQPGKHTQHRTCCIGNLCRQFLGWKREDLQASVQYFVNRGGVPSAWGGGTDLYYWYYGTLCAFQQGGDVWTRWNEAMKKTLCEHQRKGGDEDGSWDVVGEFSTEWGRVGQTALCCLCLEVYYRYLPRYR